MSNATIYDVAEKAGVSTRTVGRYFKAPDKLAQRTRQSIEHVIQELQYRPNASAQAVRNQRFKSILMLRTSGTHNNWLDDSVFMNIQNRLSSLGYKLLLGIVSQDDKEQAEQDVSTLFRENYVDGIIVCVTHDIPKWLGALLDNLNVPLVWLGSKESKDCIHHDDFLTTKVATENLISLGHQDIGYVDFCTPKSWLGKSHFSSTDRLNGYMAAMKKANCVPRDWRPDEYIEPNTRVAFAENTILKSNNRPSAVICFDVGTCQQLFFAYCRQGLSIPEDLSIITFNHMPFTLNDVSVNTLLPSPLLGTKVADRIVDKVESPEASCEPITLPFILSEGNSIKALG